VRSLASTSIGKDGVVNWMYVVYWISACILIFILGTANGYRNGLLDGKVLNASREKKQLELLVRAFLEMNGNHTTRQSRTVSDIQNFLNDEPKTQWVRSIRLKDKNTIEEDTFANGGK
jgi:hypothetical protein